MFTVSSRTFRCERELAEKIAGWAGLRLVWSPDPPEGSFVSRSPAWRWEDRQTGGGGCRITWRDDIAWVSRHSGYAWADVTEEVCYFFQDQGARPIDGMTLDKDRWFYPSW